MSAPTLLQSQFGGMRRLEARDNLPDNAVWNLIDWVPYRFGAALRSRSGWTYSSPALTGGSSVRGLCRTPAFGAGEFNVAVTSNGGVDRFTDLAKTNIGTAYDCLQNPIVHRAGTGWLVLFPDADGTTALKSWDGTTFGTAAGTPPAAIYGDVWYDQIILANGTAGGVRYPGRAWYGPAGNSALTWDTTYGFWDFAEPIQGVAVIRNTQLFFFEGKTQVMLGDTSPQPPTASLRGNLREGDKWFVGCLDARSIAKYGDTVIWAGPGGVYQSDGITLKNLIKDGGMATYWFDALLNSYDVISGGIVHDTYICSITNAGATVDTLCYDFTINAWYRMSNIRATCWTELPGTEKVYFGLANTARVGSAYQLMHPDSGTTADADGTTITPTLETRYFRNPKAEFSLQTWKNVYVSYDVRAGTAPTYTVSFTRDPYPGASYTAISPVLAATTSFKRVKRSLGAGFQSSGLALKITQTNPALDSIIHAIEIDYAPLESSRLAQP